MRALDRDWGSVCRTLGQERGSVKDLRFPSAERRAGIENPQRRREGTFQGAIRRSTARGEDGKKASGTQGEVAEKLGGAGVWRARPTSSFATPLPRGASKLQFDLLTVR